MGVTKNVRDLIRERFGVETTPYFNRVRSSIGATAGQLWRQDASRLAAYVINLSTGTMFQGPFGDVSSTKGVRLSGSGGFVLWLWDEDFDLVAYEHFIIGDAAGLNLLSIEWVTRPGLD